ncbi:zinc-ribbon domain-containing protein [Comamonas sp. JC664]|uniref:zinc-ribbon domain-containing protein n=1 Tax=Comamonas sp. JC664 TaxID=2801917 RepID=UPI0036120DC9
MPADRPSPPSGRFSFLICRTRSGTSPRHRKIFRLNAAHLVAITTHAEKGQDDLALINCNECGKQISDQASSCPHCGAPVAGNPAAPSVAAPSVAASSLAAETVKNPSTFKYILYGTFVVVVAISCMSGGKRAIPRVSSTQTKPYSCANTR